MQIETPHGTKEIRLSLFDALDGWEIQNNYIKFTASADKTFRRAYTLEVLGYATVVMGENDLPLSTDALIDNHLGTWQNVQKVFEAVLRNNGIDPETHADRDNYWSKVGAEIATAFLASCTRMIGPMMSHLAQPDGEAAHEG